MRNLLGARDQRDELVEEMVSWNCIVVVMVRKEKGGGEVITDHRAQSMVASYNPTHAPTFAYVNISTNFVLPGY